MTTDVQQADDGSFSWGSLEDLLPWLRSIARGWRTPVTDEYDLVQKTVERLLERGIVVVNSQGEINSPISEDLRKIAYWVLLDIARNECRKTARQAKLLREKAERLLRDWQSEPVDQIAERDLRALVWKTARERLSDDELEVFLLRYRDGLTDEEIAKRLNLPLGTVKGRLRRALEKMRDALGELF